MTEAKKKTAKKKAATASPEAVVDTPVEVSEEAPVGLSRVAKMVADGGAVNVKNISDTHINTSMGSIEPGSSGLASPAEARQLGKWLEKI